MGVIKVTPKVWDYLYDNQEVVKRLENIKQTIHKHNTPKLKELFDRLNPDAVVCTQAFPCGMVSDYKKTYNSDIKLIAVLTDYIPHSYWVYDNVDCYVTPSEDISVRLAKKGVPAEKIKALGIPIDPKFNEPCDRNKIIEKLKLEPNIPTILIMGGGQGLGPIKSIVKSLEHVKYNIQEIIVTGTNTALYNSLQRKIQKCKKKIYLYSFVNNINELMSASDIIISKPGGVTTSEVLSKTLPMIILKPIPGQETNNANYLTDKGSALRIDRPRETHLLIEGLLKDPERLKRMKECARIISKPNASIAIAELLLNA